MNLVEWSSFLEKELQRPCLIRVNGKSPLDPGWPEGPFDDPDGWREKLSSHQGNVGIVLGRGLAVVDVDSYKPRASESWEALVDATGLDLNTVVAATGGGGRHFYFTYPAELHVPSIPLGPRGYPGVELKSDGGMAVVEPSRHPVTGQPYLFEFDSRPGEVVPTAFTRLFLELAGAVERTGPRRRSQGRWHPLADDEEIDPRDREFVEILLEHFGGHSPVMAANGEIAVSRPGKDRRGSKGFNVSHSGPGLGWCFTNEWPPFEQNRPYDLGQLRRMAGLDEEPTITVRDVVEFPPGYRLWREGDDIVPAPELGPGAYHGLIGEFLTHVAGRVEAHPAAIGAHLIPAFGTVLGRHVAYTAGPDLQYPKLYLAVVGPTSSGGKGAAMGVAMYWINRVSPGFLARHSIAGIGSGETLIYEMRDTGDDEDVVESRRIVFDAELSRVLRVVRREGSILGDVLRTAFDAYPLRHSTRKDKVTVSTNHHLSIVGSITPSELRALTEELAVLNGFANRYLYVWSEIPLLLPFGGLLDENVVEKLATRFHRARQEVMSRPTVNGIRAFTFAPDARDRWEGFYRERRKGIGDTEVFRAITSRQVAHAARVSLIYAALDGRAAIGLDHLGAGIAWADYSLGTIRKVFTAGPSGKPGQLLTAIRETGGEGLDGAAQDAVFGKNLKGGELAEMRSRLEEELLIHTAKFSTGGRPRVMSYAITPEAKAGP
jgi:hypothetical protein